MAAHLILALYWTHQMDSAKITRYIGLAHQSNGIICDSPGPLVAALTFVSVILYDAKVLLASKGVGQSFWLTSMSCCAGANVVSGVYCRCPL